MSRINGLIGGTRLPDGTAASVSGVHSLVQHNEWRLRGDWPPPVVDRGELFCFCPSIGGEASSTTMNNLIGAARTLTLVNGTSFVANTESGGLRALSFTGSSYCTFPTTSMVSGSGARSMCLWSKPSGVVASAEHMYYGTDATNQAFRLSHDSSTMYGSSFGTNTSTSITDNVWTHWGLIYSGTTMTLYKNGVSVSTASVTLNTSLSDGAIGAFRSGSFTFFLGAGSLVDAVRYWSSAVNPSVFVSLAVGRSE